MLTKEDLQAIGELLVAEREETKKIVVTSEQNIKTYIELNNTVLGTIFKVELATAIKDLRKVILAGFEATGERIRAGEVTYNERLKQLEERVAKLEKQQASSHS